MSADHQQEPQPVAELRTQSFNFPGTTVNFSHAVVQPGHLEPPENGSNFTADGPPFLWTNPDSLEMIMRQDEPGIGTGFGRGPDEGLGNAFVAFVGGDSRGGAAGFEEPLSNAQSKIAAQPTSTTTRHSPPPPDLPLGTSGPSRRFRHLQCKYRQSARTLLSHRPMQTSTIEASLRRWLLQLSNRYAQLVSGTTVRALCRNGMTRILTSG